MSNVKLPEFDLLAAACRWPPSTERRQAVRTASEATLNWPLFTKLVKQHRVTGLTYAALQDAGISPPEETMNLLSQEALTVVRQNLLLAAETIRIQNLLDAEGIPNLTVKGTPLGIIAYGSLALKQAWDIDLLLNQEDVVRAYDILCTKGYEFQSPDEMSREAFATIISVTKECVLVDRSREIFIELHWRLSDNPNLLPHITASGRCSGVEVTGVSLRTLEEADLFTYLCVHGTAHGWSRLKWLADVNALISSKTPEEIEKLYDEASVLGAQYAAAVTLILCAKYFRTNPTQHFIERIGKGWRVKLLLHASEYCIKDRSNSKKDLSRTSIAYNRISHIILSDKNGYLITEISRIYNGVGDKVKYKSILSKLFYPIIRISLILWRQISKRRRR